MDGLTPRVIYSTGPAGRDKKVEMPFAILVVSVVVVLVREVSARTPPYIR